MLTLKYINTFKITLNLLPGKIHYFNVYIFKVFYKFTLY